MTVLLTGIVILAAGQSSRMRGTDKLLEVVAGAPLIRRQAITALEVGLPVWITLPPNKPLRAAALEGLPVSLVYVPDAEMGLAHSIRAANSAVPSGWSIFLLLADLPDIEAQDLQKVYSAAKQSPNSIIRATTEAGLPGHPIVFPASYRAELGRLTGDQGAREILKKQAADTVFVRLPGERALTDLDTPEQWADWRAQRAADAD
jgi:molybdenum cofactor cytidylyltransferase